MALTRLGLYPAGFLPPPLLLLIIVIIVIITTNVVVVVMIPNTARHCTKFRNKRVPVCRLP